LTVLPHSHPRKQNRKNQPRIGLDASHQILNAASALTMPDAYRINSKIPTTAATAPANSHPVKDGSGGNSIVVAFVLSQPIDYPTVLF
ncbi:hypothetical protein, partial [Cedecea colo]|uniref:hypothetical protein n=1 Tax=Cedecea colo TaxID=2552946 RepID=UPI00191360A1